MRTAAVALVTSDNSAHGYNWTFAFPMILFIVIAASLYLVYTRPHKVPGHGALRFNAAGGGAQESVHEAAGAHQAADSYTVSGNVSRDADQAATAEPDAAEPGDPPAAEES